MDSTQVGNVSTLKARYSALLRHRGAEDSDTVRAQRDLMVAVLAQKITRAVENAPPMTVGQRAYLSRLMVRQTP